MVAEAVGVDGVEAEAGEAVREDLVAAALVDGKSSDWHTYMHACNKTVGKCVLPSLTMCVECEKCENVCNITFSCCVHDYAGL